MADETAQVAAPQSNAAPITLPEKANWVSNEAVIRRILQSSEVTLSELKARADIYRNIEACTENLCCLYGISKSEVFDPQSNENFKNVAQNKVKMIRESWGNIKELVEKISDDDQSTKAQLFRQFAESLFGEIGFLVNIVIQIADNHLRRPEVQSNSVNQMFYHKMKADFSRYLAEVHFTPDNVQLAKNCDTDAWNFVASLNLDPDNPSFLGFVLNRSVFLREVSEDLEGAIKFSQEHAEKATAALKESSNSPDSIRCQSIIKLMNENLELWKGELAEMNTGEADAE